MDALQEFVDIASWVAGYVASYPVVMDTISNAKPIRYHGGKSTKVHSWTSEGTGRQNVMVDGRVRSLCIQVVQSLTL